MSSNLLPGAQDLGIFQSLMARQWTCALAFISAVFARSPRHAEKSWCTSRLGSTCSMPDQHLETRQRLVAKWLAASQPHSLGSGGMHAPRFGEFCCSSCDLSLKLTVLGNRLVRSMIWRSDVPEGLLRDVETLASFRKVDDGNVPGMIAAALALKKTGGAVEAGTKVAPEHEAKMAVDRVTGCAP